MANRTTAPKMPVIQELANRLAMLEKQNEDRKNPSLMGEAGCNRAMEVRPIMIPVTLQTSDDSQVINLEVPLYEVEHSTPQAVHNFLELCRLEAGPNRKTIDSITIQVNFKNPVEPEKGEK